jgi:hypothetical protein
MVLVQSARCKRKDHGFLATRIRLDSSSSLQPVHHRHVHIHEDQPRAPFLPASDGGLAVLRAAHRKTNAGEQFYQPIPIFKLIVDHQNLRSFCAGTQAQDTAGGASLQGYSGVPSFDWSFEKKYRALARLAADRDIATHQACIFAAYGQPQPGSLLIVDSTAGLAERFEQFFLIRSGNTRARVRHAGR